MDALKTLSTYVILKILADFLPVSVKGLEEHEYEAGGEEQVHQDGDQTTHLNLGI